VELPGIEPASLPGLLPSELPIRYVSFPFSTARYLRVRFQVLTASRAVAYAINLLSHFKRQRAAVADIASALHTRRRAVAIFATIPSCQPIPLAAD
jgi:hypothetical protein